MFTPFLPLLWEVHLGSSNGLSQDTLEEEEEEEEERELSNFHTQQKAEVLDYSSARGRKKRRGGLFYCGGDC